MALLVERTVQLPHQYLPAFLHLRSPATSVVLKPYYGSTAMVDEGGMSTKAMGVMVLAADCKMVGKEGLVVR